MKVAGKMFGGVVVWGVVVFIAGVSFAQIAPATGKDSSAVQAKHEARIKLLLDSAMALQPTNPDLAKKLTAIVNDKNSPDWKVKHEERIQLYKDAATALQMTRPDLAKGLLDMTVPRQKTEMQEK